MVERSAYLDKLRQWKDEQVIKVVTGIRRCGKSTLLQQYRNWLRNTGVSEEQIISINFEDLEYEPLLDYRELYRYITQRLPQEERAYIFLDEIQKVESFEKAVDSLYIRQNVDIYLSGSNAYLLSSDLATLLTGRYVEIRMLPLSYSEFSTLSDTDADRSFTEYLKVGGFPYLAAMKRTDEKVDTYLEGIYNTVIVRDIEDRQARREQRRITDIALLKTIARYLASTVGSPVSLRGITDYMTSNGRKISPNTVSDYVEALTQAFIFYPVERMDVSGKQLLKANRKFYIVDLGLRNFILPRKHYDLGFSLENIVYLELLRRNYRVTTGRVAQAEVDFVAEKEGVYTYFQVTADMTNADTFAREMRPLENIRDNYGKIVLTADKLTVGNYNGIVVENIRKWLED